MLRRIFKPKSEPATSYTPLTNAEQYDDAHAPEEGVKGNIKSRFIPTLKDNINYALDHATNLLKNIVQADDPRAHGVKVYDVMAWQHEDFYTSVFTPSGVSGFEGSDSVYTTLNDRVIWAFGNTEAEQTDNQQFRLRAQAYEKSLITRIATFLGLPTYLPEAQLEEGQTWLNILFQFLGYKASRGWWNILTVPVFTLFNLLTALPKLALNVARIFTEIVPFYVQKFSFNYFNNAMNTIGLFLGLNPDNPKRSAGTILLDLFVFLPVAILIAAITGPIALAAMLTHYVGKTVTSPFKAASDDWNYWRNYRYNTPTPLRYFYNTMAALAVLLRLFTFGAVVGAIAAAAAPGLAALAPSVAAAIPFLAPVFSGLTFAVTATTSALVGAIPGILTVVSLGVAQAVVAGALVGAAAAIVNAIGSVAKPYVSMFTNWLHKEPTATVVTAEVDTSASADAEMSAAAPAAPLAGEPAASASAEAAPAFAVPAANSRSIRERLKEGLSDALSNAYNGAESVGIAVHGTASSLYDSLPTWKKEEPSISKPSHFAHTGSSAFAAPAASGSGGDVSKAPATELTDLNPAPGASVGGPSL